jgi:nitroreductase
MHKPASNQFAILDLLKTRWSPRAFSSRKIEREQVLSLFEAARWAPSGGNLQPWFFIVADDQDQEAHLLFSQIMSERNAGWAKQAPILVLAVAQTERSEGQPNPWAYYDLGQAVAHLNLQASAFDLSIHQIGGFDKDKARKLLQIPEGYDPVTMIAIGYQGNHSDLPEDLQKREMQPRVRKPVDEFVFRGTWNEPISLPATEAIEA